MVKKVRFLWRLLLTFASRRKTIILIGFLAGISFFLFSSKIYNLLPQRQETKIVGQVGRYTLDNIPKQIQNLVSLGLTQINEDGTAYPALAKEWSIEDGGKTFIFKLNRSRFWHDKTEVKAKDINYNFKDVEMEVVDDQTIKFKLKEPFSPFPVIVSKPLLKKGFIGAGPYKVKKITRNGDLVEAIQLESLDKKKPHLKFRFYPTEGAAKTALRLGEVDVLENIINPSGFEDWQNVEVKPQVKTDRYLAVFFDTSRTILSEKSFRQALAYALPKEKDHERAFGPLSPSSWAYNADVKPYEYNLENAKQLFEKEVEKEKKVNLRLATVPSLLTEAEKIAKAWSEIGVKTDIEPMEATLTDFEALLAIQEIPPDPDQYTLWHSSQEMANITHLNNPRIDQLLEEGRKTLDPQMRKKTYFDFQRFLVEEVPAIFLYHPVTYEIRRK